QPSAMDAFVCTKWKAAEITSAAPKGTPRMHQGTIHRVPNCRDGNGKYAGGTDSRNYKAGRMQEFRKNIVINRIHNRSNHLMNKHHPLRSTWLLGQRSPRKWRTALAADSRGSQIKPPSGFYGLTIGLSGSHYFHRRCV